MCSSFAPATSQEFPFVTSRKLYIVRVCGTINIVLTSGSEPREQIKHAKTCCISSIGLIVQLQYLPFARAIIQYRFRIQHPLIDGLHFWVEVLAYWWFSINCTSRFQDRVIEKSEIDVNQSRLSIRCPHDWRQVSIVRSCVQRYPANWFLRAGMWAGCPV